MNPYSAPRVDAAPFERLAYGDDLMDASQGQRFSNLLIDYFCYFSLCFVLGGVLGFIGAPEVASFISWPVMIGYYVFFEGVLGATPGKMVTRTRVVGLDGGTPSLGQILGRTLSRFVPFEAFSFLGSGSGWHDRWSKTRVVRIAR
ncbi:MAG TPA: RDD family protein [Polyangiaceae bacterium]|nr:RDD family protein [Polyangiaceae bacterium]